MPDNPARVPQRDSWNGQPTRLEDRFTLRKARARTAHEASCQVWTHQFGWELRLEVNGDLLRSQVCRSEAAVRETADTWKAALLEKGWQDGTRRQAV
jgi:hypothetical protein